MLSARITPRFATAAAAAAITTARSGWASRLVHTEAKLEELGHTLPPVGNPKGSYKLTSRAGNMVFLAGHLPITLDGSFYKEGKVGADVTVDEANEAAKWVALNIISTIKAEVGDLDKVVKVHKLVGFVNCVDGFTEQPQVVNGCSDLIGEVFGARGEHARSAVGTNALPLNVPVEIEAIIEVEP